MQNIFICFTSITSPKDIYRKCVCISNHEDYSEYLPLTCTMVIPCQNWNGFVFKLLTRHSFNL